LIGALAIGVEAGHERLFGATAITTPEEIPSPR
jgi:hypothetical protein